MNSAINHSFYKELPFYKLLIRCLILLAIFSVVSLLSALVCSVIFFNTENPTSRVQVASLISLYFSVAFCSIVLTRINKQKWLLGGLTLGIMIYLVTLLLAFFVNDAPNAINIIYRALIPLISTTMAFISRQREKSHSKPRHKRRKFKM